MPNLEQFRIDSQEFVINGIRYARPGAEPLIFIHGVMSNCFIWELMASKFYEEGFDVWMPSLRGHGNANLRSYVKHPKKGSHSFTSMVTEDVQAIIDHVFSETKKKSTVIGHSNGANVARASLGGIVRDEHGRVVCQPARRAELASKLVKGFVSIGGSHRYEVNSREFNTLVGIGFRLSQLFRFGIPNPAPSVGSTQQTNLGLQYNPGFYEKLGFPLLERVLSPHILNFKNFGEDPAELMQAGAKCVSAFPADLAGSYLQFINTGKFAEAGFDYETAFPHDIPSLYIAGEHDSLALPSTVTKEVEQLQTVSSGKVEYFLAEDTGHADLVMGKRAADLIGGRILEFLNRRQEAPGSVDKKALLNKIFPTAA